MYGKIISIEDVTENGMDGYKVLTDTGEEVSALIDNGHSCCENWGYFSVYDKVGDFLGAELLDVKYVDEELFVGSVKEKEVWLDVDSCVFVNLETSVGTLQLTIYNSHNGYYSHLVKIKCSKFEEELYL